MINYNTCILGYSSDYRKFLKYIKDKKTKYQLKIFKNINDVKKTNNEFLINQIIKKKIKYLALCNKKYIPFISNNVEVLINNKIKVVQASNNFEVDNHGFIIEKPFKGYSFEELFLRKILKLNDNNIKKIFRKKIILITGGAGSIGSGIVKKLMDFDLKNISIIDNSEYNTFKLKQSIQHLKNFNKVHFYITNIENYELLLSNFKKINPDIVFNAAALKHVSFLEKNAKQGFVTNVLGTYNVIKASEKNKVKYFIHISTDKAADPKNVLGYTKLISEYVANSFKNTKMHIGIVRFGNVFNSYGSVSEIFQNKITNIQKIKLSHPNVERYFMSILESVNLIISSLEKIIYSKSKKKCRTFICNMGKPIKINDLARKMLFLSGRDPNKNISKKYYGLSKASEKISEKLISKNERIINANTNSVFEISTNYRTMKISDINSLIKNNLSNIEFIKKLKKKV